MYLYLISQDANDGYDSYDSAVVAAPNAEIARSLHPRDGIPIDWDNFPASWFNTWCDDADEVRVELLGKAKDGTPQGVILASFNAG